MVKKTRLTDLGMTITSLDAARLVPGTSWWEWNSDIPGRLPAQAGEPRVDRHGVMDLVVGMGHVFIDGQPIMDVAGRQHLRLARGWRVAGNDHGARVGRGSQISPGR